MDKNSVNNIEDLAFPLGESNDAYAQDGTRKSFPTSGVNPSTTKNMRSCRFLGSLLAACFLSLSCSPEAIPKESEVSQQEPTYNDVPTPENPSQPQENMIINITVGSKVFKADIENTETGKAFIGKLPLTLDMSDLNGNEKYCYGVSLPREDKYYNSIAAGDLMLYSGNCIVLFYGSAGGYSYTRIGKLASTEGLKEALGTGSVKVSFEKDTTQDRALSDMMEFFRE